MNNINFVISIGDHKRVIYAKILNETKALTSVISLANTHINRRFVLEREASELKNNRNCMVHTYKVKNRKFKTIHKCLVYNFMNTQDRLAFMDNLVQFLVKRRFPDLKKLVIFEMSKASKKMKEGLTVLRMLKLNPKAIISTKTKVYFKRKLVLENGHGSSQLQHTANSNASQSCMNVKIRKRKKKSICTTKVLTNLPRRITRSITLKNLQSTEARTETE